MTGYEKPPLEVGEYVIDIMKYGYKLSDIIWYINKQPHTFVITMWYDYLNMCDQMGIVADKYPQDIKVAHDTVMAAFQAKETQYLDARLNDISSKIESSKVIPESDDYIIKLPHSSRDFVAEGQAQHNCVGSYIKKMSSGDDIVFLFEKKTTQMCRLLRLNIETEVSLSFSTKTTFVSRILKFKNWQRISPIS